MDSIFKLQNGSDIRGIALEGVEGEHITLTESACNKIARAFTKWLAKNTNKNVKDLVIGVGMDSRISGPSIEKEVVRGILQEGGKAIRCGLATTPAMFMGIIFNQTQFTGSIMITASHLPFNRNGLKFFNKDGGLEHDDITEILKIASLLEQPSLLNISESDINSCAQFDLISLYAEHLKNKIINECSSPLPLTNLKIVVDSGNGASGFFVDKILKPLGADTTGSQFLNPDGRFPNHIPNPENKQAMEAIQSAVLQNHADLGLIFDTDVDRMSAVLHNGEEVNRDAIIAMISAIIAPEYPGSTIITDSVTSDRLTAFLQNELGLKHLRYMRGYKNVINKQKELNANGTIAPLAMETSGHGALKDNYFLDDGAFLAVKMVIALANASKQGKKLDSLIEKLSPPGDEVELRFKINTEDFKAYGENVLKEFKSRAEKAGYTMPASYEGIRLSFDDADKKGWLLLRLSLHDPVMPLNIEGCAPGSLEKIKSVAKELLTGFSALDITTLE